ncbi:MAG: hypothetical protein ACTSUC_01760 [Promethearchaeota archaeon]
MNSNEKLDILRHIKLGVKEVFYYDYDGNALPLRPISSYELDDCFYKALEYATPKVADLVIKLRLKIKEGNQEVDFNNQDYLSLQRHYDAISYWVVFHSMKDFQDEDFKIPTYIDGEILPKGMYKIRKMSHIHDMANIIINTSHRPKSVIKQIIRDKMGRNIATLVFYLNVPLADFPDITKLQRDYLIYYKGEITKVVASEAKEKQYEFSGKTTTIADIYKKAGIFIPEIKKNGESL